MDSYGEILNFAIGEEQAAAAFYISLAAQAPGADTRQALMEFAREEQGHEARLKAIQTHGGHLTAAGAPVTDLHIADYLVDIEPRPDMPYRDLLMLAMKKELAANHLYTALAAQAELEAADIQDPEGDLVALAQLAQ